MTRRTAPWKVLSSQTLLDVRYMNVERQRVELGSGTVIDDFHLVGSPDWAGVICVTDKQELVLVEQYRHGHGGVSLELPAGVIEPGEDPMVAAAREMEEETGYTADEVVSLWKTRPDPARHTHWAHFGFAKNAHVSREQRLDDTEDINVVLCPTRDLDAIVQTMVHATHVAALLFAAKKGLV